MSLSPVAKGLLWGTIGANVYIWARWNVLPDSNAAKQGKDSLAFRTAKAKHMQYMNDNFTLSRQNMADGRWWTLLTSAFSHQSIGHLGINMMVLHATATMGFSPAIGLGPARMAVLALGSALCGSTGALYDYQTTAGLPVEPRGLGASGMVQGIMVATMLAVPRWPVNVFFIPVEIPYWAAVAAFVGYDMYRLYQEKTSGQRHVNWMGSYTGFAAHLGGGAFGAAFYFLAMRRGMVLRRAAWPRSL